MCDCRRRRRRRLVMNLTSRLEFISVTRRGALALEGGPGLASSSFLPLFLKPVRQFRGCWDLRRRAAAHARKMQDQTHAGARGLIGGMAADTRTRTLVS